MKTQHYPSPRRGGTLALVLLGLCLLTACTSSTPGKPSPGNAHLGFLSNLADATKHTVL